jgi:hypothetical protein
MCGWDCSQKDNNRKDNSAGTSARLVQYSGGGNTSTASSLRGALDLVSLCFSGLFPFLSIVVTGAWLGWYGGEGETSTASASRGARSVFLWMIFIFV